MILLFIGKVVLFILAVFTAYIVLALLGSIIPVNTGYRQKPDGVTCYLSSDGIHTDFVVPTSNSSFDWRGIINKDHYENGLPSDSFLGIGWGDRGFYLDIATWNDLTFKVAAHAMLIPSPTLMHIIVHDTVPSDKKKLATLHLSEDEYLRLCSYITEYFKIDESAKVIHIPDVGYTPNDNFYEANEKYHAFNTCNYWINRGLIRTGIRTAVWSPSDRGIFLHLERFS